MPGIEVEIEIWCSCGEGLCNQTTLHRTGRGFEVEPCEKCLSQAKQDGYEEAKNEE